MVFSNRGQFSAGFARMPPRLDPIMVLEENRSVGCKRGGVQEKTYPRHQTKGIIEYARAIKVSLLLAHVYPQVDLRWCFSTVTSSATVV
jgi:hypothetical protein